MQILIDWQHFRLRFIAFQNKETWLWKTALNNTQFQVFCHTAHGRLKNQSIDWCGNVIYRNSIQRIQLITVLAKPGEFDKFQETMSVSGFWAWFPAENTPPILNYSPGTRKQWDEILIGLSKEQWDRRTDPKAKTFLKCVLPYWWSRWPEIPRGTKCEWYIADMFCSLTFMWKIPAVFRADHTRKRARARGKGRWWMGTAARQEAVMTMALLFWGHSRVRCTTSWYKKGSPTSSCLPWVCVMFVPYGSNWMKNRQEVLSFEKSWMEIWQDLDLFTVFWRALSEHGSSTFEMATFCRIEKFRHSLAWAEASATVDVQQLVDEIGFYDLMKNYRHGLRD